MEQVKAKVSVKKNDGYKLRWCSRKSIKQFTPCVEEITFYNEKTGEDVIVPLTACKMETKLLEVGKNLFEIVFTGSLEFELSKKELSVLKSRKFNVDYVVGLKNKKGDQAENGKDFELVENKNINLTVK
jgi:hypothetical protein